MAFMRKHDDIKKIINTKAKTKEDEAKTSGIVLIDKISDELMKHPDYHTQYTYKFSGGGKIMEGINSLTEEGRKRNEFLQSDTNDLKRLRREIPVDEMEQHNADRKFEEKYHLNYADESFRRQMHKGNNFAQFWLEPTNRIYVYDDEFEYMKTVTFDDLQKECREYLDRRVIEETGKARMENFKNLVRHTGHDEEYFYKKRKTPDGKETVVESPIGFDSLGNEIIYPELDMTKAEIAFIKYFDKVQEVFPDYASIKFERRTAGENYCFEYEPKMRLNGHNVKLNQFDRAFEQVQRRGDFERGDFEKGVLYAAEKGRDGAKYIAGYQVSRLGYDALSAPGKVKKQGEGMLMSLLHQILGGMRSGMSR